MENAANVQEKAGSMLRYRDSLENMDKEAFDKLMKYAGRHVGFAKEGKLSMFETMLIGMLMEQQKQIDLLRSENPLSSLENV